MSNEQDAAKRQNLLAQIQDGLKGPDAWYWRDMAEARRRALREDEPMFGLVAHEQAELNALDRLLRSG